MKKEYSVERGTVMELLNDLDEFETVTIDDLKENTAAAGAMGIHTWNLRPHQEDVTQLFIKKQHLF